MKKLMFSILTALLMALTAGMVFAESDNIKTGEVTGFLEGKLNIRTTDGKDLVFEVTKEKTKGVAFLDNVEVKYHKDGNGNRVADSIKKLESGNKEPKKGEKPSLADSRKVGVVIEIDAGKGLLKLKTAEDKPLVFAVTKEMLKNIMSGDKVEVDYHKEDANKRVADKVTKLGSAGPEQKKERSVGKHEKK